MAFLLAIHRGYSGLSGSLDPAIIHYTGDNKPWGILSTKVPTVAFPRLYRHTMKNELFHRFARHRWKRWWLKKLRLAR